MTTVVFRCDSSTQIGSGHIIRCRTIARELKKRGANIKFVCRKKPGDLIGLIKKEFDTFILGATDPRVVFKAEPRKQYQEWLGCTEEQDATEFLNAINESDWGEVDWLIVDHYGLASKWESIVLEELRKYRDTKMMVIDDLADRKHMANFLIDQNYFGDYTYQRYDNLIPSTCTKLLGPHYAILSQEYSQLNPIIPRREEIKRILVFFGGADNDGLTLKTLEAVNSNKYDDIVFDIVVGMQSLNWREIKRITDTRTNMKVYTGLNSLAGLMARADLAVGGCGTTTWERACLNLPSIVVTVAENQETIAMALHDEKWIDLIGKSSSICTKRIRETIDRHLAKKYILNDGKMLTDGHGCSRISMLLMNRNIRISLREAVESDEILLLGWANDTSVRNNSFNREKISAVCHHKWFSAGLKDRNRLHYIAVNEDNCPVGQIRFDRREKSIEIDFSLDPAIRGRGIGPELLKTGLGYLKNKWGSGYNVIGNVLINNTASSKSFKRAGFSKIDSIDSTFHTWHFTL